MLRRALLVLVLFAAGCSTVASLPAAPASEPLARPVADVAPAVPTPAASERPSPTPAVAPIATMPVEGREAAAARIVVRFRDGATAAERAQVHAGAAHLASGARAVTANIDAVELRPGVTVERALTYYRSAAAVSFAEPDFVARVGDVPNDALYGSEWGLAKIGAPAAWDVTHGSAGVLVAVLDSGVYSGHPDLAGKVVAERDFSGSPYAAADLLGHGTHVAGIIAAQPGNGIGVAGVGWSTRLLNGKVCYDDGSCTESAVAAGIAWAVQSGAKVINLSLGATGPCSLVYADAIAGAWSHGVVVVASAGNDGSNVAHDPASCPHVVSVASTDQGDARSVWSATQSSAYGTWVTVAAPGTEILSTSRTGGYVYLSGTSMAAPFVSGVAALVWATSWGGSAQSVVDRVTSTAARIAGTGSLWASGRVDAAAAVGATSAAAPSPSATAAPACTASPAPTAGSVGADGELPGLALRSVTACGVSVATPAPTAPVLPTCAPAPAPTAVPTATPAPAATDPRELPGVRSVATCATPAPSVAPPSSGTPAPTPAPVPTDPVIRGAMER